jgi:hypothetical protein
MKFKKVNALKKLIRQDKVFIEILLQEQELKHVQTKLKWETLIQISIKNHIKTS